MKRKSMGIKWHLFLFMFLFSAILIVMLWFFQIVYLDEFYKYIKTKEAKEVFSELVDLVEEEDSNLENKVHSLARDHGVAVFLTQEDLSNWISAEYSMGSSLLDMPETTFWQFVSAAENNDGSAVITFVGSENVTLGKPEGFPELNGQTINGTEDRKDMFAQNMGQDLGESAIYVALTEVDGTNYVIMMNMVLTPITTTVETLKVQLMVITVILVICALVISLFASVVISKPIVKTNDSAKRLAEGDFSVEFVDHQYREIGELSDTLNYAAKELGKTEQFQHELIANVSHDLRTPLTMITGYAEVMRDLPGENTPENVQVVIDEANRLTNLVNDMLDMSKLQAGVLQLNTSYYNLTDSVRRVLNRYNKLREQEGYVIDFVEDGEAWVEADEDKIYQVIYNLINNAINYTGEDKRVTVRQMTSAETVRIEVTDTGDGIPEEELGNVWERYYKVDKTHKRSVQGTGLGLSIVKNILRLHEAEYGVESALGKGSTFWFTLRKGSC